MNWHDAETIDKTLASWRGAMSEILAICPKVRVEQEGRWRGNGYPAPCQWRPLDGQHWQDFIADADAIRVTTGRLMNLGRPEFVQHSWDIWRSAYFKVWFPISRPFDVYQWQSGRAASPEYVDDAGVLHEATPYTPPAIVKAHQEEIVLQIKGPHFGLKDWHIKATEIAALCDGCKSERARKGYARQFKEANNEVARWEEAVRAAVPAIPATEPAKVGRHDDEENVTRNLP